MKSEKSRLLIVTNLYPLPWEPNRATFNRQQFSQLDEDYDVAILVPVAFPDWWKHRKAIDNTSRMRIIPRLYLPKVGRRLYALMMWWSIRLFAGSWIKRVKPEKVFASWAYPDAVAARRLAKWLDKPFYFKVHGSDINMHGQVPSRSRQIVDASADAKGILSVSSALKQVMVDLGIHHEKIHTIYNGVNHQLFTAPADSPTDKKYVLYVGNLKHDKGVMELLEGFSQILTKAPDLHLVYAGDGPMRDKLNAYCQGNSELQQRVTLLGQLDHNQLPAWMQHAHCLALPSYNEGVPNVVLESMACGTPVLATTVGGIPEVVPQQCGVLIAPRSSDAVAQGLTELNNRQWDETEIQAHAQTFSWQRNRQELLQLLSL